MGQFFSEVSPLVFFANTLKSRMKRFTAYNKLYISEFKYFNKFQIYLISSMKNFPLCYNLNLYSIFAFRVQTIPPIPFLHTTAIRPKFQPNMSILYWCIKYVSVCMTYEFIFYHLIKGHLLKVVCDFNKKSPSK